MKQEMYLQRPVKAEFLNSVSSTNTTEVLRFASEHWHKMSTRTSTVYKYVKEHFPISYENSGVRELQAEDPCFKA
jgi:hypothetical protein